jgi:hypothetical protein
MGLVRRAGGGAKIPPGEKLRFRIGTAQEDEGDHGPQARLELEVLNKGPYEGVEFWEWCKIALDEDTDEQYVAEGGKLFNVAMACFDGQVKVIDSFTTIPELLDALEGRTFVSITKSRGKNGDYIGITWDMVYTDTEAKEEEGFNDLPF